MKFSATAVLFAAALGVSAHPSGHSHRHFHRAIKFYKSVNDVAESKSNLVNDNVQVPAGDSASAPSYKAPEAADPAPPAPAPAATPEPKPAPPEEAPPSSGPPLASSGGDNGKGQDVGRFCGSVQKRATAQQITSAGNTGGANYGCNLQPVSEKDAKSLPYTIKLNNVGSQEAECTCFLKVGKDGGVNGSFKDNLNFRVKVSPSKYQYVAIAKNTKGACTCSPGSLEFNSFGQVCGTWAEFDIISEENSKGGELWSGADASSITASIAGKEIPGMRVYEEGKDSNSSVVCPKSGGQNAYLTKADEAKDGIGLDIKCAQQDSIKLVADIGHTC